MYWIVLAPLMLLALWSAYKTVVLVMTDGYGDVPPPRSHAHETRPAWRVV